MQLRNHIANRFLTDAKFLYEIVKSLMPEEFEKMLRNEVNEDEAQRLHVLFGLISNDQQKAYYITNTVVDKLDMLKVSTRNWVYDWTVFKNIAGCKLTFIFKDNSLLRVWIHDHVIQFFKCSYKYYSKEDQLKHKVPGEVLLTQLYIDRDTGELADNFFQVGSKDMEDTFYKLLCFFFLSENEEIIVNPGKSYGTKKQHDALSNDTNLPVTIINSCWNITSIRTEGFDVRGHFRLQPCGPGLSDTKMIFIQPFKKEGYVRKAAKPEA